MSFDELCQTVPGALLEYYKIRYSDPTLASSQKSILITLQFVEGLHNNFKAIRRIPTSILRACYLSQWLTEECLQADYIFDRMLQFET